MVAKPKKQDVPEVEGAEKVNLARFLSTKAEYHHFEMWIVGDSPLICHAWSEKAKGAMLQTHVKAVNAKGKEIRVPTDEFTSSLYKLPDGGFGFPATAIKKCLVSVAHKDKGIPQTAVMRSLWIDAPFVKVETALDGARCNLPLVRLYGSDPVMREDMVRIGSGMRRTANLAYRAEFSTWAIKVKGRFNSAVINRDVLSYLISESGPATGIGDWRNEKGGAFGSFRLAKDQEAEEWELFRLGKGKLPVAPYLIAAE